MTGLITAKDVANRNLVMVMEIKRIVRPQKFAFTQSSMNHKVRTHYLPAMLWVKDERVPTPTTILVRPLGESTWNSTIGVDASLSLRVDLEVRYET